MASLWRIKCACGNVANAAPGQVCPKCKRPYEFPQAGGYIQLYRKGSPMGIASGFGLYLNDQPLGYIGNKETVKMPVPFGTHKLHVAVGMSRKCTDLMINVTPQAPRAFVKVWMKPGFWTNSFVLEPASPEEMPNVD